MIKKLDKNKLVEVFICLLITLVGFYSYFNSSIGVFKDQDLTFHLNRFVGLAKAFEEGQILPKIYPYTNNGFGYASPLFYCDLFLYPFGILNHFGVPVVYCYKLCVLFYSFLGNLFVYFILKKETKRIDLSLLGVVLYFGNSYHLYNLFIRNALGEILAMTFIPLVICAIYRVLIKKEDCFIFLGVSFSLLVMAHLITSLLYGIFFFCMIIVFVFFNYKDKELLIKTFKTLLKGTVLALLLTCWYLVPMFEQLSSQTFYLNINAKYNNIAAGTFSLGQVFSLLFNSSYPSLGGLFVVMGLSGLFIKNKYIKIISAYCALLLLIVLGILPGNYLNIIQFYFRLYVVVFPLFSVVLVYLLDSLTNKKGYYFFFVCLIIYCLFNVLLGNSAAIKDAEAYLNNKASDSDINNVYSDNLDYNHDELGGAEYLPYSEYVDYDNDSLAIKYLDDNEGLVDYVYDYDRNFSEIVFYCDNDSDLKLLLPLSWYKGYSGYELVDGEYKKIDLSYSEKYKEVLINSSNGEHTYKVKYTGTFLQYFSLGVSFISLTCVLVHKRRKS